MALKNCEIEDCDQPVLHTPRGAAPRGLKSDAFEKRSAITERPSAQSEGAFEERIPVLLSESKANPAPARDWDFALPDPLPPKPMDLLMDKDANWRQHAGLRPSVDAALLSETTREKFTENWERLASEPRRVSRGRARRKMERSPLTRWLFSHGQFDFGTAVGPLLLIVLLVAAIIYGQRLLTGEGPKSAPPAEARQP